MVLFRHQTRQVEPLKARRSLCKGHTSKCVLECAHRSPSAPCKLHCLFKPKGIPFIVVGITCRVIGIKVRKVDPVAYGFRRRLLWKDFRILWETQQRYSSFQLLYYSPCFCLLSEENKGMRSSTLALEHRKGQAILGKEEAKPTGIQGVYVYVDSREPYLVVPRQRNYPNGLCSFDMLLVNLVRDCRLFSV